MAGEEENARETSAPSIPNAGVKDPTIYEEAYASSPQAPATGDVSGAGVKRWKWFVPRVLPRARTWRQATVFVDMNSVVLVLYDSHV